MSPAHRLRRVRERHPGGHPRATKLGPQLLAGLIRPTRRFCQAPAATCHGPMVDGRPYARLTDACYAKET